jgi:hypothetical protein
VLKRAGLEATTCECYAVVKKEVERLLHDVQHRQESMSGSATGSRTRSSGNAASQVKAS